MYISTATGLFDSQTVSQPASQSVHLKQPPRPSHKSHTLPDPHPLHFYLFPPYHVYCFDFFVRHAMLFARKVKFLGCAFSFSVKGAQHASPPTAVVVVVAVVMLHTPVPRWRIYCWFRTYINIIIKINRILFKLFNKFV